MISPENLYKSPNELAPFYSRFRVAERLLLTGHSHQAWPDCGLKGQEQAWLDAAQYLDKKWDLAFAKAELVRNGFSRMLDDTDGYVALGANTHDLVVRFLSALPLRARPRILTTDGEFHSLRRQLDRMAEEGVEIARVPSVPAASVAERLMEATDERTAAVMVSSVFYLTGHIVPHLGDLLDACRKVGAELLVDVYHSLNVVPLSLKKERLEGAFIVGGGYKYCQLGEGNGFLRFPKNCTMRPAITGWFSEFQAIEGDSDGRIAYGQGPWRFAGSTYDPTSHYRAVEVLSFFAQKGLSPEMLREVSQHQVGLLATMFDRFDTDSNLIARDRCVPLESIGGFLVLHSPRAAELSTRLLASGVHCDHRGEALRLGPAPYLCDDQLREAMDILGKILKQL